MKPKTQTHKAQWLAAGVLVVGACLLASPNLMAASLPAEQERFGLSGHEVSDEILGSMRGRFVDGRSIAFFGVQMRTFWQESDGLQHSMQMDINMDFTAARHQPVINIYHSGDLGSSITNANVPQLSNVTDNNALDAISGVVQNIQVAGDSNSINNDVQWSIQEQGARNGNTPNGLVSSSGGGHYLDAHGRHTQVFTGGQGLGYQIDIPGVGRVTQQLGGGNVNGGSLLQSSQINSNRNQVLNRIGLQVDLTSAPNGPDQMQNLRNAFDQLRGL